MREQNRVLRSRAFLNCVEENANASKQINGARAPCGFGKRKGENANNFFYFQDRGAHVRQQFVH